MRFCILNGRTLTIHCVPPRIIAAPRSAIINVGEFVLPEVMLGITEASIRTHDGTAQSVPSSLYSATIPVCLMIFASVATSDLMYAANSSGSPPTIT